MTPPADPHPEAASVRAENRPWLKGAMDFFEKEIQRDISILRSSAAGEPSYRPPDPSYQKQGCLIGGCIPIVGLLLIIFSITGFDYASSAGTNVFTVGVIMLLVGPFGGAILASAIAAKGAKSNADMETEREIIDRLAEFLGFGYISGSNQDADNDRVRIAQMLEDNGVLRHFNRHKRQNQATVEWSDPMRVATSHQEARFWLMKYDNRYSIAILGQHPDIPPNVDVVGHGMHRADPRSPRQSPKVTEPFQVLTLESSAFNNRFDVYGTDQVLGRRALTPYTMHRLKHAWSTLKATGLSFVFSEGYFGAMIAVPGEPFQLDAYQSLFDREAVLDVFDQLAAVRDIIDGLNISRA